MVGRGHAGTLRNGCHTLLPHRVPTGARLGSDGRPDDGRRCPPVTARIRPFAPGDEDAVLAVVFDAFSSPGRDGGEEVAIVRGTWSRCARPDRVELVADEGGAVVGHVLAAPGRLDGRASAVAGVAPVCVAPAHQGNGTGSALVRELIRTAEARAWPLLVLLGDPAFYGRFGFEPAGAARPQLRTGRRGQPALPGAPAPRRRRDGARGVRLLLGVTTRRRRRRRPARAAGAGCPRSP